MRLLLTLGLLAVLVTGCKPTRPKQMKETNKATEVPCMAGYAPVNGLKMYYEVCGSGYPLVLIHGGGSTIQTAFGRILPLLAKNRMVIAVEMQAHGHTADIDRPLSFEQDADDIAGLLKHLNIAKADVFGFSNGASTTLQFALRHPEHCNKIIVASTFYKKSGAPDWFWAMMSKPTFEGMPQVYKDAFLKINPDTNALHRMYERDVTRMMHFPEMTDEQIKSIKADALILVGDKDVVKPEHAVEMHNYLANSRLAILPGGHGDYIGEITTPQDSVLLQYTVSLVNAFLGE